MTSQRSSSKSTRRPTTSTRPLTAKKSAFKHHLLLAFGRYKLDEIGMRDIEAYKAKKLAAGLKPKSLNNHLTMLRKALELAPIRWTG